MGYGYSSRGDANVVWVVGHTAEGARTKESLGSFFWDNPNASSHVGIDAGGVAWYVERKYAAWTLGPGNPYSMNAELCAFAGWTRDEWLTTGMVDGCENPRAMLGHFADWVRGECIHWDLPFVKLTPAQLGAWGSGVAGHVDYTYGMDWGSHTDPGSDFPWDVVMDLVGGGDGKDAEAAPIGSWIAFPLDEGYFGDIDGPAESHGGYYEWEKPLIRRIQRKLQALGYAPSYTSWADGIYGPPTVASVREWQADVDLPVDGNVGRDDWNQLFEEDWMAGESEKIDWMYNQLKDLAGDNEEKQRYQAPYDKEGGARWWGTLNQSMWNEVFRNGDALSQVLAIVQDLAKNQGVEVNVDEEAIAQRIAEQLSAEKLVAALSEETALQVRDLIQQQWNK